MVMAIFCAAVLAAAETGFTRVSRTRAEALAAAENEDSTIDHEPDQRFEQLRDFSRRPLTVLASLSMLQIACQITTVAMGFVLGRELGNSWGAAVGVAVSALVLVIAVLVGRGRALIAPDATALKAVPLLRVVGPLGVMSAGLVRLIRRSATEPAPAPDVDEQELLAITDRAKDIDHEEAGLIKRVVEFDDTTVGEIMTPRTDLVMFRSGLSVREALQIASESGLSRIPVLGAKGDVDDVIGAVHVKDLVLAMLGNKADADIDRLMVDMPVVPTTQRISNLLPQLQERRFHLAMVVDEHGGVAGAVTLEDVLEELVGEIEDEFDLAEAPLEIIDNQSARADGRAELDEVAQALACQLPEGDYHTVAGCFFSRFGRVPEVGSKLQFDGVELEVLRMQGRRIADVLIRVEDSFSMPIRPDVVEETNV